MIITKSVWGALVVASLFGVSAQAAVTFTITGTANQTAFGYTEGQAVTFTFVTNDAFTGTHNFEENLTSWYEDGEVEGTQLWASIAGTGLTGAYSSVPTQASISVGDANPSDGFTDEFIYLGAMANSYEDGVGLFMPNGEAISWIPFGLLVVGTEDSHVTSYIDIMTYFSEFAGNYPNYNTSDPDFGFMSLQAVDTQEQIGFTVNNLNISVSSVPEPSAYAVWAGACGLLLAAGTRKRRLTAAVK